MMRTNSRRSNFLLELRFPRDMSGLLLPGRRFYPCAQILLGLLLVVDEVENDLLPVRNIVHVGPELSVEHQADFTAEDCLAGICDGEESLVWRGARDYDLVPVI